MMSQMAVLLRIKELKQEQAFRAMRAKREQVTEAQAISERERTATVESARTLPAREDAVYAPVLGTVVGLDAIDELHGRIVGLQKDHERLKDSWERAKHVQARLETELEAATDHYRQATKVRDKYEILTDRLRQAEAELAEFREEGEIEDLFSRPGKRIA